ncbi:MAG: polysaccharide biosynthesis protein, partial [Bdellovibrionales bacterium]|nr:polysaccharide biosynthesis protein [Bdellovibrionales bacterium]
WFLLLVGIGGGRFAYRLYRENFLSDVSAEKKSVKTLVVGAGYAGQQLVRDIKNDIYNDIEIVGFVDDDPLKDGKLIFGKKVLGKVKDISRVADKLNATQVIIAMPSATKQQMSLVVDACKGTNLEVRSVPKLSDIISGKFQVTKLHKVQAQDLLGREQIDLKTAEMASLLSRRVVLITGAGGSIGSELCNQIVKLKPSKLICYDVSELNMYQLTFKLESYLKDMQIEYVIGDVRDIEKLESVFVKYHPDVVFHAAAYKHVPLMELNPIEAIKVNVLGTQVVARLADKYNLQKFVLVSTDKAVNPTNVMGATKRIAEMVCQVFQKNSKTKFVVVRFGNVLGSSGSVIPRFKEQIENGGPVTVTHPDIIRYFMSIPEAAQLVLQAGSIGNGGEIFVLDMGEPVKIDELARQMITLTGLRVGEDIQIEYVGLRPGEKLFEELLADGENTLPTKHKRVRVAQVREVDEQLFEKVSKLIRLENTGCIRTQLKEIVPEYEIPKELMERAEDSFDDQADSEQGNNKKIEKSSSAIHYH